MNDNPSQIKQNYQEVLEKLSDERVLKEIRQLFQRLSNLGYHPQVIFDIGASNGS